jgi:hypothetical protein
MPRKVTTAEAVGPASAAKVLIDKSKAMTTLAKRMEAAANALNAPEVIRSKLPTTAKIILYNKSDQRIAIVDVGFLSQDNFRLLPLERQRYYTETMLDLMLEYTKELMDNQYDELRRMGGDL